MFGKPNAGARSKDVLFFVLMASSLAIGGGVANSALSAHECAALASFRNSAQERIALHRQLPASHARSHPEHVGFDVTQSSGPVVITFLSREDRTNGPCELSISLKTSYRFVRFLFQSQNKLFGWNISESPLVLRTVATH